jgi:hypothetical protein
MEVSRDKIQDDDETNFCKTITKTQTNPYESTTLIFKY